MGMYDEVRGLMVFCPNCGTLVLSPFQTKSLECRMHRYKPGDKVKTDRESIEVHTWCRSCGVSMSQSYHISVHLRVVNGILTNELV